MPAQNGCWLDDEECILPTLYLTGEQHAEPTINGREMWPFDRAAEDDELLTQQQVFGDQLRMETLQDAENHLSSLKQL